MSANESSDLTSDLISNLISANVLKKKINVRMDELRAVSYSTTIRESIKLQDKIEILNEVLTMIEEMEVGTIGNPVEDERGCKNLLEMLDKLDGES